MAVLAVGWTMLTNGYPTVYCPPTCSEAAPLSDVAHLGSLALGPAAAAAVLALWRRRALWRGRARAGWVLPAVALALVMATIVALSRAAVPY